MKGGNVMNEWLLLLPLAMLILGVARFIQVAAVIRRERHRVVIWSPRIEAQAASFTVAESQVIKNPSLAR